jgi:excisionase family DNA binding protein
VEITRNPVDGDDAQDGPLGRNALEPTQQLTVAGRQLVDGADLGRRLGVGRTTIWRLTRTGRIPYYAIGRRWLYCIAEVVEALRVPAAGVANANHGR